MSQTGQLSFSKFNLGFVSLLVPPPCTLSASINFVMVFSYFALALYLLASQSIPLPVYPPPLQKCRTLSYFDVMMIDELHQISYIQIWILRPVSVLLIGISVTVFGIKADVDRQWIPNPDSNFLSWSFGCACLSGFFSIFSALCLTVDHMRITEEEERAARGPAYAVKPNPRF